MSSALLTAAALVRTDLPGAGIAAVDAARVAARACVQGAAGLADARSELWRYLPLRALEALTLAPAQASSMAADDVLPVTTGARLVFVNGVFDAAASCTDALPPGVRWLALSQLQAPDWTHYAALLDADGEAIPDAWNLAQARGGHVLDVAPDTQCTQPLEIVYAGTRVPGQWHARSLVRLGSGARLVVRERYLGGAGLASVRTRWQLAQGAHLDLLQQQQAGEDMRLLRRDAFTLQAGSSLKLHALQLGAGLSRHELAMSLAGPQARVVLRQLALLDARQHGEQVLDLLHAAGATASDLRCRAVASGRARAVLHGAIRIAAGADGSDAALDTRNLLLSDQAEVDARPTMEILADEVRAAHGASVGQLDADMLFYLRARGLDEAQARAMLIAGHGRALLADIADARLRTDAEAALDARVACMR